MRDSLKKLGYDYGLTPEGVRHAIEVYQDIICEITGGKLSKLTYDSDFVLEEAEEHYKRKYGSVTNNDSDKRKTCKYHCDYGDGEYCYYTGKSGCTYNETESVRLIDANKLIDVFEKHDIYLKNLPEKENPSKKAKRLALNWCINTVIEQPTVPHDMKWNPECEDCKPEDIRECQLCRQR